jgi:hypothetical protein
MNGAAPFRFEAKNATYWGIIWGVGVGIVEYLTVAPIDEWGSMEQLLFWLLYWMMPFWCVVGYVLVWLADREERVTHRGRFLAVSIAFCVICAILQPLLSIALVSLTITIFPGFERYAAATGALRPEWTNWTALSLFQLWETLFYGSLLVAARIFTVRVERAGHLLHQSAMARSRTEALLDVARLQALQSQIDPNLLLDSMQELEQRYRVRPERAERLLEALVEFLRYAMHGLQVSVSTLDAELHLARAFSHLQQERGVEGAWCIIEEPAPGTTPFKFPSLLMLPLLALGGGRSMLRVRMENGQAVLSLNGLSQSIPDQLRQQIQTRLYALYGERFHFECQLQAPRQLRITLPLPLTASGESHA